MSATSGGTSPRDGNRIELRNGTGRVAGLRLLAGDAEGGEHRVAAAAIAGDFAKAAIASSCLPSSARVNAATKRSPFACAWLVCQYCQAA